MQECLFCKIINGDIPCYKIYEDEYTLAFLDISNDTIGHTLVIPKKHYENIFEVDKELLMHVMDTTQLLCNHYKSLGFKGVNIQNNNGECAGQSVFHLHVHILPRGIPSDCLKKLNLNQSKPDLKSISEVFFTKKWHSKVDKLKNVC